MDIRNSVLWTGKIPEIKVEEKNGQPIVEENIQKEIEEAKEEIPIKDENEKEEHEETEKEIDIPLPKFDYKVPSIPIVNNPNVIRSAPVNPYNIPNNFNPNTSQPFNNYYNTFLNPYVYQNQNFNYLTQPRPIPPMNYNIGIISNNFQGKIPVSYGNPYLNQYVANLQNPGLIGMNMNINRPSNVMPIPIFPRPNINNNFSINPIQPPEPKENDKDDIKIDNLNN
jgi:hypothetical protein